MAVVETAQKLDQYLESNPDEDLVVVGPDVTMAVATEVAETYRLRRPFLGVVLMRRRMEVSTMTEALRAGVREVVLADDVEALVGAGKRSMAVSEQLRNVDSGDGLARGGKIILVFSSKGGCGKTTISTNLAAALSSGPDAGSVCLLDFDLETGDVAIALQMDPTRTISDALGMQGGLDERTLASLVVPYKASMDALLAPTKPSDAEFVSAALAGEIVQVAASMYDYVVIDAPPAFTDVILRCFDIADAYVLLTTLDMPALKNLKVTLDTLDNLGFPRSKWQMVLNRGGSRVGSPPPPTSSAPSASPSPSRSPRVSRCPRTQRGCHRGGGEPEARRGRAVMTTGGQTSKSRGHATPRPTAPVKRSLFKRG